MFCFILIATYIDLPTLTFLNFKNKSILKNSRHEIFPSIKLAHEVLEEGMHAQIALNASNEIAVDSFLNKKIKFLDIFKFIQYALDLDAPIKAKSTEVIIELR